MLTSGLKRLMRASAALPERRAREGGFYSAASIIDFRKSPLIWRGTSHDFVATPYITDNNYYNKSVVHII